MCESFANPHMVGFKGQQENLTELLNSSASVSDISEAASDMSLSTSPGSDIIPQSQRDYTMPVCGNKVVQHPKKRQIVRQLSSNPYLTSSEASSPRDPLSFVGSHSYSPGDSQMSAVDEVFIETPGKKFSQKAHSYPLSSNNFWNSEEESDTENGNTAYADTENTLALDNSQQQTKYNFQSSSFETNILKPGVSPTAFDNVLKLNNDTDLEQTFHHYHNSHPHHYQNQQYSSTEIESNISSDKMFNKNSNQNEISIEKNVFSVCQPAQGLLNSGPSRSRDVNSWGHFYQPTSESYYKYRRSHHCSDSDEEEMATYMIKLHTDIKSSSKSHAFPQRCSIHNSEVQSQTDVSTSCNMQSSTVDSKVSPNGMKPYEFKERFQLVKKWFSECNDGQKNIVLKGLLNMCEPPQLHLLSVHMSKELHQGCPSNCEDIITWLPSNLATKVISYLDPVSLCRAAQVCKVWRHLAEDQSLWRRFCCQTKWRLSKAAEHKQVISHMSPEGSIQWKNVFAERFRLRNNWLKGRCTVRTFEGHMQGISCVQFDDSRIVSGSSDKTIKVWNMRTNAPWSVQTLIGHHGTVRCLHLEGNRLVSGSCDKTIKVWDLSTQESWSSIACKVTMTGHSDTVRCLQADDDKVISGSYDKTLKIWDLKTGQLRTTLRGHQASVLCVQFSESKIVSGSADKTINVWSHDGRCMMTLIGHQDAVTCLMFDSTRIVSGSLDRNLKFWDIHTGKCLNTLDWKEAEGHTDVVRCLQADSWRVVSAADDKTIKVWNLATGERLVTLRNHTDGITCLQFNDFIIVSGSYDKSVKLWDFTCC